jgi:beta-glucanase (GH16 family)
LVYEDDFSTLNNDIWSHEVQTGGFGTGEFEWTTADKENSYVVNNTLVIMPTLTDQAALTEAQVNNGYTLNLTTLGTCTSSDWHQCVAISNSTANTVINPVRSARLTTKLSKSIKYGKVEVVAKLPIGDWLWPAIWMMPVNSTYGTWPASGEIDIMESRGNAINYPLGGIDSYSSTLHWGIFHSSLSNVRSRSPTRPMVANLFNPQHLPHKLQQ